MASKSLGTLTLDLVANIGGFEKSMDKVERVSEKKLRAIEKQAAERAKAVEAAFAKIGAGLAAGLGAIKFADTIKQVADTADAFSKLSQRTGATVKELSQLNYAASLNDASLEDLAAGLKGLSNKMLDAQRGSGDAAGAFKALGIEVVDGTGKLRPVNDVLLDVADAMSKMKDGAGKAALANKLMEESGIRLIPMLDNGRAGIQAMAEEGQKLGVVMDDKLANAAVKFNDNITRLNAALDGLKITVGGPLVEYLARFGDELKDADAAGLSFLQTINAIGRKRGGTFSQNDADQLANYTAKLKELQATQAEVTKREGPYYASQYDDDIKQAQAQVEYYERRVQANRKALADQAGLSSIDALAGGKASAPALPTTPKSTSTPKAPAYVDPFADQAKAYADAMGFLNQAQLAADTSGQNLTATQQRLVEIMTDPAFMQMPETWRVAIATQGESALQTEKIAADQARLNELLAATPTAQLEAQRQTMQFLAEQFEKGRISAQQFNEAASAALGNTATVSDSAKDSFLDLATVANDGARAMAGAFGDFVSGSKKDFGSLVKDVLAGIAKMMVQAVILKSVQTGMSAMGFPGLKFADGGTFGAGSTKAFAKGSAFTNGIYNEPTFFKFANGSGFSNGVMGEAGPEAVMPLSRGPDGKLGVTMQSNAGALTAGNVTVNVVNQADGTKATATKTQNQDGSFSIDVLIDQIEGKVSRNIARGRSTIGSTIERTYGLNRAAGAVR